MSLQGTSKTKHIKRDLFFPTRFWTYNSSEFGRRFGCLGDDFSAATLSSRRTSGLKAVLN